MAAPSFTGYAGKEERASCSKWRRRGKMDASTARAQPEISPQPALVREVGRGLPIDRRGAGRLQCERNDERRMSSGRVMPFEYFRGIEENERAGRFWLRGELPVVATKAIPASSELLWVPADTPGRASGVYKDVRITYKTNAHGWRSREIDPASPNKKIIFVGCSYTMGIGLPYEDVWTS